MRRTLPAGTQYRVGDGHARTGARSGGGLTGDLLARISRKIGHAVSWMGAARALIRRFVHKRSGWGAAAAAVLDQIGRSRRRHDTYNRAVARLEQAAHAAARIDAITAGR